MSNQTKSYPSPTILHTFTKCTKIMNNDTPRPLLVKLGVWGIKTRATALAFVCICVGIAVVSAIRHFWIGLVMLLAAAWYWYAMRWVDKHGGWK